MLRHSPSWRTHARDIQIRINSEPNISCVRLNKTVSREGPISYRGDAADRELLTPYEEIKTMDWKNKCHQGVPPRRLILFAIYSHFLGSARNRSEPMRPASFGTCAVSPIPPNTYPFPSPESGNELVTPLGLCVSMGGGGHLLSDSSPARLTFEYVVK
ncbi:hypothetical protein EVAR_59857_1 [Eumeta japonica]|uniref:Uncharacterized protein n=1 Tax=Eumeta variegata TaxID=151549 RepID=A0A4C1Z4Q1_EUMVA|nr:hypothetical protein EVAR_59857_1 [Eumeta japonica]